jgi:hypothetical protein
VAEACQRCGAALGFVGKVRGQSLCGACQKLQDQERVQARNWYAGLVRQAALGMVPVASIATDALRWRAAAAMVPADLAMLNAQIWREALETVLADDLVTQAEEDRLNSVGQLVGIDAATWHAVGPEISGRFLIARMNDGRLPQLAVAKILLKKGETAHMEIQANLMKEVVDRETRGSYSGMSFRVAKGVRFSTGGYRGMSVVVGSHIEVADQGPLTLTSMRAVFCGLRKTVELPYSKLLSVNVFNDGIQFQMSNRQSAPLFKVPDGRVAAAVVNAAYQRL